LQRVLVILGFKQGSEFEIMSKDDQEF